MNRLVLLGTRGGPAVRTGGAMPTASFPELDGRRIIVDCGIGVTRGLGDKLRHHLYAAHTTGEDVARIAQVAGDGPEWPGQRGPGRSGNCALTAVDGVNGQTGRA